MARSVFPLSFFLLLCLSSSISTVESTGLKVRITDRAQDVLKELGVAYLETLVGHTFPDFQIPAAPGLRLDVNRFTFTELNVAPNQVVVRFQENSGLQFEFQDLRFTASLQRQTHVVSVKIEGGPTVLTGGGVRATIGVRLQRTQQGRLNVEISKCEIKAESIGTQSNNGLWFVVDSLSYINLSRYFFNNKLCPAIESNVIPVVNTMLEAVAMETMVYPDRGLGLDYTLSGDVAVSAHSLDVPFRGLVFRRGTDTDGLAGAVPQIADAERMAYVGVSEVFFQSAAQAVYSSGPFILQDTLINAVYKVVLAAMSLPKLPAQVALTEAPAVTVTQNGVSVSASASVQSVARPNDPPLPVNCQLLMKVEIQENHLKLLPESPTCKTSPPKGLAKKMNSKVDSTATSLITDYITSLQIPLPDGVAFTQTVIRYHDGYLVVGGDLALAASGGAQGAQGG